MKQVMKRIWTAAAALLTAVSAAACGAPPAAQTETTASSADLQAQLEELLKTERFSGVVRVTRSGEVICEAANGTLSPESDAPIATDTQFGIGSVSKQFCAACVMLLQEDGKLSVDDTLDKYFPDYAYGAEITVKNLLTMRSGIRDYVNDSGSEEAYWQRYDFSDTATAEANRQATREWIFSEEPVFQPDTAYAYCNSNYFLLADIVEQVSGERYGDFLKARILDPLGMNDTGVAEELSGSGRLAPPVFDDASHPSELMTPGVTFGDGDLISTAADVDKWLTSLRAHTVLSEASVREMTTDYSPDSGHYGYGIFIPSADTRYHEGEIDSYLTHAFTSPEEGYNLFAVTNRYEYAKLQKITVKVKGMTRS